MRRAQRTGEAAAVSLDASLPQTFEEPMSYLNREHRTAGPLIERKRARKSEALIYKQPRVSYDCRNGDHSKCAMATCSCQQCPCKFKSA